MNAPLPRTDDTRSIGAILVDQKRLKPLDAERISRHGREKGLRFGDAALRLKLLTEEDIDCALACQFEYPYLARGENGVADDVIAAYNPKVDAVEALRALRSQLMLRWFNTKDGRRTLAIVSAERGEGRSWLAANLAVVFAQLGERTLLIDADLRAPRQHTLFNLDNVQGLSTILCGRAGAEAIRRVSTQLPLSILPAGAVPPNPQELLSRTVFEQILEKMSGHYDVILIDTPPTANSADAQIIAARAGGVLMLARQNHSRYAPLTAAMESLSQVGVQFVGSVVNQY